ncbi:hypothetical protein QFZ31_004485 [Neobacillus niacini]|uniref:capsular polysaccharide synthesis protein n=1 Tax=Neobacillus driksii TaxID=3035913 RepID=UPI00278AC825|nr:capsular polysaccharide synthesis protein [Neobacillus niacini]MDQ0974607.1 hypothetical protein [Neobacillus niacini]
MGLKQTFEKQGGITLLKRYWQSGALFTALGVFLLLGKSRTALEILRLSTQLKAKQKLEKKYKSRLAAFDKDYDYTLPHEQSNKVWVCWFQGMENAPALVQKCFQSLQENLTDREIILITADNIADYVKFPDFIIDKWEKGQITHTHMTDLLRLELLINHGGLWLDATVFCTCKRDTIPDYYFDSDLFLYQCLKPGRDGHSHLSSSWLMSATTNNKMLMAIRYLCYEYWKMNTEMLDYFLLHDFISIVFEHYQEEWKKIVPSDNATPHILLLRLFDQYDKRIWEAIKGQAPFHKMTYKFKDEQTKLSGTYYDVLFR